MFNFTSLLHIVFHGCLIGILELAERSQLVFEKKKIHFDWNEQGTIEAPESSKYNCVETVRQRQFFQIQLKGSLLRLTKAENSMWLQT